MRTHEGADGGRAAGAARRGSRRVAAVLRVARPYRPADRRGDRADVGRRRLRQAPRQRATAALPRPVRRAEVEVRPAHDPALGGARTGSLAAPRIGARRGARVPVSQRDAPRPVERRGPRLEARGEARRRPLGGFHTFRHTCATMLFRHGLNAKQVQMWLGHHSPAFTLATYVHLLPDDLPDAGFLDTLTGPGRREAELARDQDTLATDRASSLGTQRSCLAFLLLARSRRDDRWRVPLTRAAVPSGCWRVRGR